MASRSRWPQPRDDTADGSPRYADRGSGTALASYHHMGSTRSTKKSLLVTVISNNQGTRQALEAYLRTAGVAVNGTGHIERVLEMTPLPCAAVIVFPDDYSRDVVTKAFTTLKKERPDVLAVIVTSEASRFERPRHPGSNRLVPLVIPKPAWAWTILDAVRARLDPVVIEDDSSGSEPTLRRGTRT